MDDDSKKFCYVGKGKCGHYYWASAIIPGLEKGLAEDISEIILRGDIVEFKPVSFIRTGGGFDWGEDCRAGTCGERKQAGA